MAVFMSSLKTYSLFTGSHVQCKMASNRQRDRRQSLVVCPQVLVGHWKYEIDKYVHRRDLNPLNFEGPPSHRRVLEVTDLQKADVVIMSYETLRADIDRMSGMRWLYCILDEGHLIRNPKAKVSQVGPFAVKLLITALKCFWAILQNVLQL